MAIVIAIVVVVAAASLTNEKKVRQRGRNAPVRAGHSSQRRWGNGEDIDGTLTAAATDAIVLLCS